MNTRNIGTDGNNEVSSEGPDRGTRRMKMEIKNMGLGLRIRADVDFLSNDELKSFEEKMNSLVADFMFATNNERNKAFGTLVSHVEKWEDISSKRKEMLENM